jgi:hypothetical protein
MTKEEQVQDHLRSIRYFSSPGMCWDGSKIVSKIQKELDAIEHLLQEPEPEEVSITKLVIRCTQLEMENHGLIQDLKTDEAYVKMLRAQISALQVTVAKTKALLKVANREFALQERYIELLKRDRSNPQ